MNSINFWFTERRWILITAILFLLGLVFQWISYTRQYFLIFTDVFLFCISGLILFQIIQKQKKPGLLIWIVLTILFTMVIEIIGVHTRQIFGIYWYGKTMHLKIFGVPLIIGFNWIILILSSYDISFYLTSNKFLRPAFAGILITAFDFIMEPVAMKLDYWQWAGGIIPYKNYFIWFLIGVGCTFLLELLGIEVKSLFLRVYLLILTIFFIILLLF